MPERIDVAGTESFCRMVDGIRSANPRRRVGIFSRNISDLAFSDLDFGKDVNFWNCQVDNIKVKDCAFAEVQFGQRCQLSRFSVEKTTAEKLCFLNAAITESLLADLAFGDSLYNNAFQLVRDCEFRDVKLRGWGHRTFADIQDSVISGTLDEVTFWENPERTQCRGLDLSNALVPSCSFTGVDMGRIKVNPAWEHLIVPDWYRYRAPLLERCEQLKRSDNKVDAAAGRVLESDIQRDEQAYGRELDAERGSAYIASVTFRTLRRATKNRIREVYADLGVSLEP